MAALSAAGCASGGAGQAAPTSASVGPSSVPVEFDETTGAIQGIVHDEELVPIAGANVSLAGSAAPTSTGPDGLFGFSHLRPGIVVVSVVAFGYDPVQKSVKVQAGSSVVVDLALRARPIEVPFSKTSIQRGAIGCGVAFRPYVAGFGQTAVCGVLVVNTTTGDHFLSHWTLAANATQWRGAAFEMQWRSTQLLGRGLEDRWEQDGCNGPSNTMPNARFATMIGPSPLHATLNDTALAARMQLMAKTGTGCDFMQCTKFANYPCMIQSRAFASMELLGSSSPADVGVVFTQPFTQYFSEFYLQTLPADFSALPDA
jgi:hypothetical protein